jgi:hypothetical protein
VGYQEQYAANAADIYLKSADSRARAKRQNGVILGNTLASLAQYIPTPESKDAKEAKQLDLQVKRLQLQGEQGKLSDQQTARDKQKQINDALQVPGTPYERLERIEAIDPAKGLELRTKYADEAAKLVQQARPENWAAIRGGIQAYTGPQDEATLPSVYPGDEWKRSTLLQHASLKDYLEQTKPAPPKLAQVSTLDDQGKPITKFVEEKAGDSYPQAGPKPDAAVKPGTIEGYFATYAAERGKTADKLTTKEQEDARKRFNQADDKLAGQQAADITKLTPAGIDMAALNYRKTGLMPPLGMGDRTTRQQILNRAAQLTPDDIKRIEAGGSDVAGNKADYKADSASLTKLQGQADAINAFENTARKNIDLFLDSAKRVTDTGIPLLNTPARWVMGAGGSADVAKYNAARQVAVSEIAKIVQNPNLTGQLSDSARHEIEVFNPANATLKQTIAVMNLLKQDMANRKTSIDQQLKDTRGRIGSTAASGFDVQAPNGKTYHFATRGDAEAFKARAGIK